MLSELIDINICGIITTNQAMISLLGQSDGGVQAQLDVALIDWASFLLLIQIKIQISCRTIVINSSYLLEELGAKVSSDCATKTLAKPSNSLAFVVLWCRFFSHNLNVFRCIYIMPNSIPQKAKPHSIAGLRTSCWVSRRTFQRFLCYWVA